MLKYSGAIIGDVCGSKYEFHNIKTKDFKIFSNGCTFTDDSVMTVAVMDMCINGDFSMMNIVDTFKKWGHKYPSAGYGGMFYHWLFSNDDLPYNSCGNGSAMRISPIGYYAKSEEEVIELATKVTEVTHNHPEGIKGAITTAMLIYKAYHGATKEELRDYALSMYPSISELDYDELVLNYSHEDEICQVTVPEAIYCFLISDSFEDCLRTTISIGGDCDTTAAISGAIAEAYYKDMKGIDDLVKDYLTPEIKDVIYKFEECVSK